MSPGHQSLGCLAGWPQRRGKESVRGAGRRRNGGADRGQDHQAVSWQWRQPKAWDTVVHLTHTTHYYTVYISLMSRHVVFGKKDLSSLSPESAILIIFRGPRTQDPLHQLCKERPSTPLTSFCSTAHSSERRRAEGRCSQTAPALLTQKHSEYLVCWHLVNWYAFGTFGFSSVTVFGFITFRDIRPAARLPQVRLRSRVASTTWRPVMWSSWARAQLKPPWWNLLPLCPHLWHDQNPFTKCGVRSRTGSVQWPMGQCAESSDVDGCFFSPVYAFFRLCY